MSYKNKQINISQWINMAETIDGNAINFVIALEDKPKILNISSNMSKIFGYDKEDLITQKQPLASIIYKKDIKFLYLCVSNFLRLKEKNHTISFRIITPTNAIKFVESFFVITKNEQTDQLMLVGYLQDITKKNEYQQKISYLSNYDQLTGLVNRSKIKNLIDKEREISIYTNTASAVLFLGLDRFKNVNDSLGHQIGDKLLQHVSHRLRSCIKNEDILSRVGGDEFVIILSTLNQKTIKSHIEIIARRIYNILERPFSIDGNLLHITTSIGVAILDIDGNNSDEILKNADTAMQQVKKEQSHYLRYYQSTMQDRASSDLEIENDLRVALKKNQFELYYQPQVDTKSDLIIGAEALIRWHHQDKGMISPLKFIPIAEATGLIIAIGNWVLLNACKRIKELQNSPLLPVSFKKISVNISPKQFKMPSFATDVKNIIKETKIDPSYLELEVTEGALISDLDDAIEKMLILKELGIKFSIDDFGTGYSSLTYLKKLPVDIIKIDQSFITDMHIDYDDKILTQTIIQMSQNLQIGLVAEGVEKIEHLNFLQEKGCETYQGFFFSKPLTFKAFKKLLFLNRTKPLALLQNTIETQ